MVLFPDGSLGPFLYAFIASRWGVMGGGGGGGGGVGGSASRSQNPHFNRILGA